MVDAAASWAVGTLRDITIEEVRFLYGVKDKVVNLESDLQRMRDFLEDADKWPERYDSAIVRRRVSNFIDLATRAEDVLEEYAVEVTSKRGERNLKEMLERFACILCECWDVHKIGKEIEGIRASPTHLYFGGNLQDGVWVGAPTQLQMQSLFWRLQQGYGLEVTLLRQVFECNDDQRLQLQRRTYGHVIEEHFVGMKKDRDRVVLHMKNIDDRSSRVISICGMGGLGKTTLARKIYQHKDIPFRFEDRAWVCITQKLHAKAIFQEILRQLLPRENKERVTRVEEAELVEKLYDIQKEKKCLVVLDDIWEINHWNILKNAFPLAESNSKILLTTRNQRVADTAGLFAHNLDFLTEDESWDLLQKIALPNHMEIDLCLAIVHTAYSEQFEATGRQLVRKCGRLPLAVSVVGGILRGQQNPGDWNKVLKNMDTYLQHGNGVDANDKRVEQVLNLSYNVLPYYLKLCFLYFGCFREDEDIRVEDVYLIWMAEGLISSDHKGRNETLWDVAERYLNELASKCMVQLKMNERFKSYRLHDLVRDLCLSKGKEEKFFEDSQGKIRRLAINLGDTNACSVAQFKKANLRSLLLLYKWRPDPYDITNIWQDLLNNALLRSLKVLVLEYCKFEDKKLPRDVRKLVMLKHLSIRYSDVREVPEFVCKLSCLQSLDLRSIYGITLPNSIGKMGRLRHLFLNPRETRTIDGGRQRLDCLMELETFIRFSSKLFDTNHLLKLTNLRRFDGIVHDIESLSVVVDHITKLKDQLREASLEINVEHDLSSEQGLLVIDSLMYCPLNDLSIDGKLRRLPAWDPQLLQNLVSLSLSGSEIVEDPMEILQNLPTLRSLSLDEHSFAGTEMVCKSKGFPQLKSLALWELRNLVGWRVEEEAMPNLSYLCIGFCPKLEMIPERMISMASITNLTVSHMPFNFKSRLRIGGENYPKISHIPFLDLGYQ
ncbi:LOW QUALITY PROTEIN: putative disease resistance protein At1g50180 [Primulina tabacum]|uniref:LOW QUALITY PROTEIN: putative disease resistance protein At1g50180 n=1 Tax=Primulina tabacum TaxID=48773 RepID=UPI003F597CF6